MTGFDEVWLEAQRMSSEQGERNIDGVTFFLPPCCSSPNPSITKQDAISASTRRQTCYPDIKAISHHIVKCSIGTCRQ